MRSGNIETEDEEKKDYHDDLIMHMYKHPIEQFMVAEDLQYFYEQFGEEIIQILDDIMDKDEN
jgi:hypothetical protein